MSTYFYTNRCTHINTEINVIIKIISNKTIITQGIIVSRCLLILRPNNHYFKGFVGT